MKPLLVIFAYGGMDDMIERHWPFWERAQCDMLLSFPTDAPCKRGGLAFNSSQHHGAEIMRRIFRTFGHVLKMGYDTYYFTEGDSICLRKVPRALEGGLHGFLWKNNDPNFRASSYPHYCHSMNRNTLTKLALMSKQYDPGAEMGFQDRLIGRICEETGIPMFHRPDLCYSRNRLDTPEYVQQARDAIAGGVCFVHGIKTALELEEVTR